MIRSACGQHMLEINATNSAVQIEIPNSGDKYLPNMNCLWEIKTQDDKVIDIKFDKFDLEESVPCVDFIEISDDEVILLKFCIKTYFYRIFVLCQLL